MKKIQHKWNSDDKQKLRKLVDAHTKNGRTNWKQISSFLSNRTPNQCKTQFSIVINDKQFKNINYQWAKKEVDYLSMLVIIYGSKWQFLHDNYFQHLSVQQLRLKYLQQRPYREQFQQLFSKVIISTNNDKITFSPKEMEQLKEFYNDFMNNAQYMTQFAKEDPIIIACFNKIEQMQQMTMKEVLNKISDILQFIVVQ